MIVNNVFIKLVVGTLYMFFCMNVLFAQEATELDQLEQIAELQRQDQTIVQNAESFQKNAALSGQNAAQVPNQEVVEALDAQNEAMDPMREEAFEAMVRSANPMSPEQIIKLRAAYEKTLKASVISSTTPPKPTATSQFVNLAPGSTPPVIRLSQGFVTSLVFLDSTGSVWPIDSYNIGDPQSFNLQWNRKDNTIMLQAKTLYKYGNLAVRLRNLPTPVMITLIPGQKSVDYRVDLRVQGYGPNAQMPVGDYLPGTENKLLLSVLEGISPDGSTQKLVSDSDVQVWQLGSIIYVRTRYKILSPAYISSEQSPDGMLAYELKDTPSLLVSKMGKIVNVSIKG